jgi:hypothetical protein
MTQQLCGPISMTVPEATEAPVARFTPAALVVMVYVVDVLEFIPYW